MGKHLGASGRCALLVDVDNIALAGSGDPPPGVAESRLREAVAVAGPFDLSLAICSPRMAQRQGLWAVLGQLPVTWRLDPGGPDAADWELLDFGTDLIDGGRINRVVVASGDAIFADLAHRTHLGVAVPGDHRGVARVLRPYVIGRSLVDTSRGGRRPCREGKPDQDHPTRRPAATGTTIRMEHI